jgi:RNA polymerase sigma-70 factor (ECF subfamily)
MNAEERDIRWKRLGRLLEPIHGQALATARRLCRTREDGEDLYQDTVLRAFEKLHTLRDESRFRSWFFATLLSRHRSRMRLKFWRRLVPYDRVFPDGVDPVGTDGSGWDEDAWRAKRMALGLADLAAEQREALVLFEIEGFSIEEIAELQHASVPAVKSRLARGRERLRRLYERNGWLEGKAGGATAGAPEPERAASHAARGSGGALRQRLPVIAALGLHVKERSHD